MKTIFLKAIGAGTVIVLASCGWVRGDVLYQNTTTRLPYVLNFPNGQEIGQQIALGTSASEYLTNFSFEYSSPNNDANWGVQADVRLYENDGTPTNGYNTPGTLFYNSGLVSFPNPLSYYGGSTNAVVAIYDLSDLLSPPGAGSTMALNPSFILPLTFTFTVTFTNLPVGEQVGLDSYGPATIGTNYDDYWFNASGNWELLTNADGPTKFGAEFQGTTQPTPEPTVICLGGLGAAVLTVIARRRRLRG